MSKVIVTGAGGFIGKLLVKHLERIDISVLPLIRKNGDITKKETWDDLPAVDHVFHLAGRNYVPESWNDKTGFIYSNVIGTQQALDFCLNHGAKMTYVSAYLYGIPSSLPIREDATIEPNNPYALSKRLAEELCQFYSRYLALTVTVIRPFNVFGPGQRQEYLIPEILKCVQEGREIRLQDLNPKRDYVFVEDVVEALVKTLNFRTDTSYNVFNIGAGVSYSVKELVAMIQKVCGTALPVVSNGIERPQEIPDVCADISQAKELLQWSPRYTFIEGIKQLLHTERGSFD
ncbi:MAG: NAD-dependent epimerase/dehydratase family protein [Candidatus Electrothrix communis]|nr:MAG: NAD-dependent epimerase/dehydratase family protein [Candidatus Electrothrix communis]